MRLGHVILYVPDVAAAVAFWQRAFGLPARFVHASGDYAELETGAVALGFAAQSVAAAHGLPIRHTHPHEAPPGFQVALVTDDPAAALAAAVAAGAAPVQQAVRRPWGQTVAYARDLNGVLVEFCTAMP